MKILFIGDIVGKAAREKVKNNINVIKRKYNPDITIVNAENATGGYGLSKNWHSLDKLEHSNILNALKKSDPLDLVLLIKKDISSCHNLFTNI